MHLFKFDYKSFVHFQSSSSTKTQIKFYSPGGERCLRATVPANIKERAETQTLEFNYTVFGEWNKKTGKELHPHTIKCWLPRLPRRYKNNIDQSSIQYKCHDNITFPCLHKQSRIISHVRQFPSILHLPCAFSITTRIGFSSTIKNNYFPWLFPYSVGRGFCRISRILRKLNCLFFSRGSFKAYCGGHNFSCVSRCPTCLIFCTHCFFDKVCGAYQWHKFKHSDVMVKINWTQLYTKSDAMLKECLNMVILFFLNTLTYIWNIFFMHSAKLFFLIRSLVLLSCKSIYTSAGRVILNCLFF